MKPKYRVIQCDLHLTSQERQLNEMWEAGYKLFSKHEQFGNGHFIFELVDEVKLAPKSVEQPKPANVKQFPKKP